MLKLVKFFALPLLCGLGIALLILLATPSLRGALPSFTTWFSSSDHLSYATAVKRAAPSVVTVFSESLSQPSYMQQTSTVQEFGSGVIMSSDGYILTNYHVINSADLIVVRLSDGRRFNNVKLVGFDTITDLALLKIPATQLPAIPVPAKDSTQIGDVVLAIGNPLNLGQTITQGIISAIGKQKITDSSHSSLLQMDAAINVGSSGGALVNSNGDLVGITSAQFKTKKELNIQGIFFAIPYPLAKTVMDKLIKYGRVTRGYMGLSVTAVDKNGQDVTNNYMEISGMRVTYLDPLGPAWQAGLRKGDIIVKIGGFAVTNAQQSLERVANTEPNTQLEVELLRNEQTLTLPVTVAKLEADL